MAEDVITRAVREMIEGCSRFFWEAFVTLRVNGISGDYVEFGSWGANTMRAAYEQIVHAGQPRHMWAFDSFESLPEVADPRDVHPGFQPNNGLGQGGVDQFHAACAAHGIPRDAYTAVEGYYSDTLPPLGADQPPTDIALAYIDCNMYSSAVSVFEFLSPRLKHGMVIGFDDYWCWSATEVSGERSAFAEFQAAHPQWTFVRYKDVHRIGLSFVVEDASRLLPGAGR
jgi:hypothetical protein